MFIDNYAHFMIRPRRGRTILGGSLGYKHGISKKCICRVVLLERGSMEIFWGTAIWNANN